jgi:phage terminase small subunit
MSLTKYDKNALNGVDCAELAKYCSAYIQYELFELKKTRADIDSEMLENAIVSFLGGAR